MKQLVPIWVSVIMIAALGLSLLLGGCTGALSGLPQGEDLMARGQYDLAVAEFLKVLEGDPQNQAARLKLQQASQLASEDHHRRGRILASEGRLTEAINELQVALAFDPARDSARQDLEGVRRQMRAQRLVEEAEEFFRARKFVLAKRALNRALELSPEDRQARELLERVQRSHITVLDGFELEVTSKKPITLKFNDANLQDVFTILSQLSGINFLFDEDIRSDRVTIYLEEATFAQALELLLKMKGLGHRVLNSKTILLYAKTKDKERQYEDQIIQTFYLSNIDAKKAVNLLRTMLQLRRIFVHEDLNALVIRDSPEVIRLAQQVLEASDRADSEVVFDVELIEVSRGDETRLGAQLNAYSVSLGMANRGGNIVANTLTSGGSTTNLVSGLSSLESFYTLPAATFDFAKTLTDTELLANPKIRVKNRQKAKVHIGSREPVITVTLTGDTQRSDNVQYVDVGVKLNVEPTIQLDDTVVTRLNLEVSSISDRRTLESGTSVFTITTTNAESVLTLRDGERTVIGGLIRDGKNRTTRSVPVLGDLPLVGSLFTHRQDDIQKREILLSITPRIVKSLEMPLPEVATIWSGGEDDFRTGPNFGTFMPDFAPQLERPNPAPAPALVKPPDVFLPRPEDSASPPQGMFNAPPAQPLSTATGALESAAGRRLSLSGPQQVQVGESFVLLVHVTEMRDLYSAPLYLSFDQEYLEFVAAREGDFLARGVRPSVFTASVARPGSLIVGHKQASGENGVSGSGELFRVEFRARQAGSATIAVDRANFRNPAGDQIPVPAAVKQIEVR
jgi:general secretion pathway protein D